MKTKNVIKEVLDMYVGSQINIDSESARDTLAKHIAAELEYSDKKATQKLNADSQNDDLYI